jgi:hypothetical protein
MGYDEDFVYQTPTLKNAGDGSDASEASGFALPGDALEEHACPPSRLFRRLTA